MTDRWIVIEFPGRGPFQDYYVALVDHQGNYIQRHPTPFPYRREADRAAAQMNIRDGLTS